MPFTRPTLSALRLQARAAISSKLPGSDGTLRRSILGVSADTLAGLVNGVYGFLDWCARQILPQSQDEYFLIRTGSNYGLSPNPAVAASGNALFTGIATTPVPGGTLLTDSLGNEYKTVGTVNLGSGATAIPITALLGGAFGNLAATAPLALESAISGVDGTAAVDSAGLSGGIDAEDIEDFRKRVLVRMQNPPGGSGTKADYEKWALAIPGVTRATAKGLERGAGTVNVRFTMDGRADPIPLSADITAVQASIDANKPLTDDALAVAPTGTPVDYTLSSAAVPVASRDAVKAALQQMHRAMAIGDGLSLQSQPIPSIASVAGVKGNFLVTPSADIAPDPTVVLLLGNVTYS